MKKIIFLIVGDIISILLLFFCFCLSLPSVQIMFEYDSDLTFDVCCFGIIVGMFVFDIVPGFFSTISLIFKEIKNRSKNLKNSSLT